MATLLTVRHAQADRPTGVDDFDQPLLPPRSQRRAGPQHPADQAVDRPGPIVSSPARRAAETVEELDTAHAAEPLAVYQESLHDACPRESGPAGCATRRWEESDPKSPG